MAEESQTEDSFFARERAPSDVREAPKPPSMVGRIIAIVVGVLVLGLVLFFTRQKQFGDLWVVNPGPISVRLNIAGNESELEPGKLADVRVAIEPDFEVGVFRGAQTEGVKLELKAENEEVTLLDLGGDAAYVVTDASSFFNDGQDPAQAKLKLLHVSPPAKVHHLPYAASKLVRPGRTLPEKGSWELQVFGREGHIDIYKVFRVDPKRLADKDALLGLLTEGVKAKSTDYENMITIADPSAKSPDAIITR